MTRSCRYSDYDLARNGSLAGWQVNGSDARPRISQYLNEYCSINELSDWGRRLCPYCGIVLRSAGLDEVAPLDEAWNFNRSYVLRACARCTYWEFFGSEGGNRCMDPTTVVLARAVARKFSAAVPEGCASELAQYLRRHPDSWHRCSPARVERLVAEIFRSNYRTCEVRHVGRPGDHGIDIVFIDGEGVQWLTQVKHHLRPGRKEGFRTIQSVLGTLALEGQGHGIVVSTADSFTREARTAVQRARGHGFIVELRDRGVLDQMLGPVLPDAPWWDCLCSGAMSGLDLEVRQRLSESVSPAQFDFFEPRTF
jgi:hypothetical protein